MAMDSSNRTRGHVQQQHITPQSLFIGRYNSGRKENGAIWTDIVVGQNNGEMSPSLRPAAAFCVEYGAHQYRLVVFDEGREPYELLKTHFPGARVGQWYWLNTDGNGAHKFEESAKQLLDTSFSGQKSPKSEDNICCKFAMPVMFPRALDAFGIAMGTDPLDGQTPYRRFYSPLLCRDFQVQFPLDKSLQRDVYYIAHVSLLSFNAPHSCADENSSSSLSWFIASPSDIFELCDRRPSAPTPIPIQQKQQLIDLQQKTDPILNQSQSLAQPQKKATGANTLPLGERKEKANSVMQTTSVAAAAAHLNNTTSTYINRLEELSRNADTRATSSSSSSSSAVPKKATGANTTALGTRNPITVRSDERPKETANSRSSVASTVGSTSSLFMAEPPTDPVQSMLENGDKRNLVVDIVLVPPHVEPVLIGANGATIKSIQNSFNVQMLFLGRNDLKYPLGRELRIEARTEQDLLKAKQYVLDTFINADQPPFEAIAIAASGRRPIAVSGKKSANKSTKCDIATNPMAQPALTMEDEATVLFTQMKGDELFWIFYDRNSKSFFRPCIDKKKRVLPLLNKKLPSPGSWFKIQYKNQSTQSTIAITSIRPIGANENLPLVSPKNGEVWTKILNFRDEFRLNTEDVKKQEFTNVTSSQRAQEGAITEKAADDKKLALCWKKTETCAFFALYKNGQFGNRFEWSFGQSSDICVGNWYRIEFERETAENQKLIKMLCNPVVEDQPDPAAQTLVMNGAIRFVLNVNRAEDKQSKCTSEFGRVWNVPTDIVVPAQFAVWCQMVNKAKECKDSDFVFVRLVQEESVE